MTDNNKRVLLCIMDGWGISSDSPKNAVKTAKSPKDAPEYFHVCKGGPVFNARDVEI